MKYIYIIFFLSLSSPILSQEKSFIDSLSESIKKFPKRVQVERITSIDFSDISKDVIAYDKLVDKAILFSKELNDSLLLADSYFSKTFVAKSEEGLEYALKANKIYEAYNKLDKVGAVYTSLGWQLKYRDLEKGFNYYKEGLKLLEKYPGSGKMDPIYDNFGVLHGMKKNWDSAIFYHKKSLKLKKQLKDTLGIPYGYSHLANVYLNTGKYSLAEKYLDSALTIRKQKKDNYGIVDTYLYYGDLYFIQEKYELANSYFEKAYTLSKKVNYSILTKYAAEYLYKGYEITRDFEKALKYNLIYTSFKDSILNIKTNSKIAELDIQFQTEKKEKELLEQRTKIAEQKNYIIIASSLALLVIFIAFLIYQSQKNKNKQLKKEQELQLALNKIETQNKLQNQRLEISRDLHDNIGAQLTFVISSLDNLKYGFGDVSSKLNQKLTQISSFTKDTIYELRDTIWAMNKDEINVEDLDARISNFISNANIAAEHIDFNFKSNNVQNQKTSFNSKTGMNVYRIIQEAVNNAIKHAGASRIEVQIESQKNEIIITIKDNGKGFDLEKIEAGNGLNSMQKRADELNASFKISPLENGTQIELILKS